MGKPLLAGLLAGVTNRMPAPYAPRSIDVIGQMSSRGSDLAEMSAYGVNPTLFACVRRLSADVAKVEWDLYRKRDRAGRRLMGGEDRRPEPNHPAALLWEQPNPWYTRQEFVEGFQQHLDLTGEAYWAIEGAPQSPMSAGRPELWLQRPDRMRPVPSPTDFLQGWVLLDPDGNEIGLLPEEVVQLKYPNPMTPYRGLGPVQTLLGMLRAQQQAVEHVQRFYENSSIPALAILLEQEMAPKEFDRFTKKWDERHKGVINAHRTAIIDNGAKFQTLGMSFKDSQYVEMAQQSDEIILRAFGMSKTMIGAAESETNRATAEAAEYVYASYQLVDRLERIKLVLNNELLPKFGAQGEGVEFDYVSPVPEDKVQDRADTQARVQAAGTLIGLGFDPTETMEAFGLPPITFIGKPASEPAPAPDSQEQQETPA